MLIELRTSTASRVLINPERIVRIRAAACPEPPLRETIVRMSDGSNVYVEESPDEIMNLIGKEN